MPSQHTYTRQTPLPPHISPQKAIALLHNHHQIINLSPVATGYKKIDPESDASASSSELEPPNDPSSSEVTSSSKHPDTHTHTHTQTVTQRYDITDPVSYLPLGLWEGTITVPIWFTDHKDGISIVKRPPLLGLAIKERWTVLSGDGGSDTLSDADTERVAGDGIGSGRVRLEVELAASWPVLIAVSSAMQRNHDKYMDGLAVLLHSLE
ncbi:hypothetical protein B0H63DRAFT_459518 [Podospora didyma]|uniref:DUF7053 domain-containing protein n=1 Tax=Podospora didyma TaxID=330526 RepID=A0AAE0U7R5_9PEZI|nr:hypothetical protein B0H63DRAFT_459518 [Podospora didyma]